jgi:flagellar hook-associated protein 1
MADLLSILYQSGQSLGAYRAAAATTSHNLDNANTPGYSRQTAELGAVLPADYLRGAYIGQGVELLSVSQARDRFLEAQIPGATGAAASATAEANVLKSVNTLDPDGDGSLTSALSGFYAGLRALAQNPGDASLRAAAVSAASTLTLVFNRASQALDAARTGVDSQLGGQVSEVNTTAATVADLNRQIRIARASGAEPNDLLDARQRAQDRLCELCGAVPVPDSSGDVTMMLPGGAALVCGDRAAKLSTVADPALGGHLALRLTPADGSSPVSLSASSVGGSMGGSLAARDGTLANAASSLDTLAFDLAGAVNAVHSTGYALDGSTGHDLLNAGTSATGAAGRLAVDASVLANPSLIAAAAAAAAVPGDATKLQQLIATESQQLSGGMDATSTLARITSDFGASATRAQAVADQNASVRDNLLNLRESTSGVSIDEEMVRMTQTQRAYEAVAKVITATDEMLDTLMKMT